MAEKKFVPGLGVRGRGGVDGFSLSLRIGLSRSIAGQLCREYRNGSLFFIEHKSKTTFEKHMKDGVQKRF